MAKPRSADQHSNGPTKIAMGIDADLKIRLDQAIQSQLDKLHRDIYGDFPGAPQARFVGYILSMGISAVRARYFARGRRKR